MAKLKLGTILDDKPVKLAVELPAAVFRDLAAYAEVLARETGQAIGEPSKLIAPQSPSEASPVTIATSTTPLRKAVTRRSRELSIRPTSTSGNRCE